MLWGTNSLFFLHFVQILIYLVCYYQLLLSLNVSCSQQDTSDWGINTLLKTSSLQENREMKKNIHALNEIRKHPIFHGKFIQSHHWDEQDII